MNLSGVVHSIAEQLKASGSDWLDKGIARARSELVTASPVARVAIGAALDIAEEKKAALLHDGPAALVSAGMHLAAGKHDDARLAFYALSASYDERQGALDAAIEAAFAKKTSDDERWVNWRDAVLAVIEKAGAAAVPLLFSIAV